MKLRVVLLLTVVAGATAALWPAGAGAATLRGVVVGHQRGLLLVATPSGLVQAIRGHAAIGARLRGSTVVGHATRVRIHGIVVKRVGSTVFLSSNRHLLALHTRGLAASPPPTLGAPTQSINPGAVVNTTVGVTSSGELDEQSETEVGQVNGQVQIQATISAVGQGTVTLTVNGQTVTVNLPAGLTLPATMVGQTVTLNVSLGQGSSEQSGGDDQGSGDQGSGGQTGSGSGDGGGGGGDD